MAIKEWTWNRQTGSTKYVISTSPKLLDRSFINDVAFSSDDMYWARPLSTEQLDVVIAQSQVLGLYKVKSDSSSSHAPTNDEIEQIGMARFITDFITTTYLCDVFVLPEHRGGGLGKWLMECCNEVTQDIPVLRRVLLHAGPGAAAKFYARELGVWNVEEERDHVVVMTRRTYPLKHE